MSQLLSMICKYILCQMKTPILYLFRSLSVVESKCWVNALVSCWYTF